MEIDALYSSLVNASMGCNQTGGGIDSYGSLRLSDWQHPGFQRDCGDTNDAVTTHCAVAFIMNKEYSDICFRRYGRSDNAAVHIGVSARLPHQCRSQMIVMLFGITTAGQNGVAGKVRETACDYSKRLAFSMGV